jgi:hypothetical protein
MGSIDRSFVRAMFLLALLLVAPVAATVGKSARDERLAAAAMPTGPRSLATSRISSRSHGAMKVLCGALGPEGRGRSSHGQMPAQQVEPFGSVRI